MSVTVKRYTRKRLDKSLFFPLIGALITTYLSSFIISPSPEPVVQALVVDPRPVISVQEIPVDEDYVESIIADNQLEELIPTLETWVANLDGEGSIKISNLTSGGDVVINPEASYISASLYKLFVAYSVLDAEQQGALSFDDTAIGNYDVAECLEAMIVVSDEDCGIKLGWLVDWAEIDNQLVNLGLSNTSLNNYNADKTFDGDKMTTASDVDLFLRQLYEGQLLEARQTELLIKLLEQQQINDRIPEELPEGFQILHKTGNLYDHVHDAGYIINPNNNVYSFSILTNGWTNQEDSSEYFIELMSEILPQLVD